MLRCTSVYGTPTMFVDMLRIQREKKFDLSSVETGVMAGAPCPQELCRNVVDEMNMKNFTVRRENNENSTDEMMGYNYYPMPRSKDE